MESAAAPAIPSAATPTVSGSRSSTGDFGIEKWTEGRARWRGLLNTPANANSKLMNEEDGSSSGTSIAVNVRREQLMKMNKEVGGGDSGVRARDVNVDLVIDRCFSNSTSKSFPPVRLRQMVDVLTDLWDAADGL
jgi:hypothetical protein